ncbi:MAG: SAM-dependent chlorinase/fluorinase [SAR324 cluster bacterium]|nr:SAM-dependent chlorinase/fluorinase [SAR324 cluster bacterium]
MTAIITLITDFGTQDGYVGAMKGAISSIAPDSGIIDITHEIAPQSILQASFCLARTAPHFPPDSIHLVVVDPGVGSFRPAVLIRADNQWLIGPDNGVFSIHLEKNPPTEIFHIFPKTENWQSHSSFDGLALFSPAAAHLASGMELSKIGLAVENYQKLALPLPVKTANGLEGEILMFDRFGNAITNLSEKDLGPLKKVQVAAFGKHELRCPLLSHYQAGANVKYLAIINSDGLLELSVFCGSIQKECDLLIGDMIRVIEQP